MARVMLRIDVASKYHQLGASGIIKIYDRTKT